MVAYFVGNHIGHGKFTGGVKLLGKFVEERKIYIYFSITWAIKGAREAELAAPHPSD